MEKPFIAQNLLDLSKVFDELLSSLSTLQSLGSIELNLLDERALLREALKALVDNYDIERCSIFLNRDGRLFNVVGIDWQDWQGEDNLEQGKAKSASTFEIEKSLMGLAVQSGETQFCNDCRSDKRFSEFAEKYSNPPIGCVVSAPIKSGNDVIGVVNMSHPEPHHFNEWNKRLLPLFSSFLGQILTAHRLLRRLEEEVAARTSQLHSVLEETRQLKQHYKALSLVDELTGLYNRRYFFSESKLALSRTSRYRHPFSLLIMDIDHFKNVNDTYGHAQGDTVLRDISRALLEELRETDILARVGGEEFAISLPETDGQGAEELGRRLLGALRRIYWPTPHGELRVTVSIGITTFKFADDYSNLNQDITGQLDHLFTEADSAMYESKRQGGNRCRAFKEKPNE